jgi:3-hydroxybutyryl-CoA dehydratase
VDRLWVPGEVLPPLVRSMTAERMRWYCDALETALAATDTVVRAGPNIHTDDGLARANGLPGRVADGMISTNWVSTLLVDTFGDAVWDGGSLRTRYVRPVFEDEQITTVVTVRNVEPVGGGRRRLTAEVSCTNDRGEPCTVGEATVHLGT